MRSADSRPDLREAIALQKSFLRKAVFFSFFTNLLVMAPSVYMLQVYDRVINSRNMTTLAMLTLLVVGLYALLELLEWVRTKIMHHTALRFEAIMQERVFNGLFEASLRRVPGASGQVLTDLKTVRDFIASPALLAMMDVPLALLYIVVIFMINPIIGCLSIVGALLQVGLAYLTQRDTQPSLMAANSAAIAAQNYASSSLRNAQVIEAMGMHGSIHSRWMKRQREFLVRQAGASDHASAYASLSKFVQLVQSSLLIGAGCWLTIKGMFPGGAGLVIVASILGGRVLTPIVQVIGMWKHVANARDAHGRLDRLLQAVPLQESGMPLPPPTGLLAVEAVTAGAPGSAAAIIKGVSFVVPVGEVVAIIGPSASGKSTLARLMVGIWPTASGKVRLDGVDIFPWNKAELGPYIGYLPQNVELFDGTVAENIARFSEPDMTKVEAAGRAVGIHDTVLALDDGYETPIGDDGCYLSGGQRQRIALARAIYGNPRFIVLDEPNSSLDEAGEQALLHTLLALKAQGTTVMIITHRTNILAAVDRMLVLQDGQLKAYGPRDEVAAALLRGASPDARAPVAAMRVA